MTAAGKRRASAQCASQYDPRAKTMGTKHLCIQRPSVVNEVAMGHRGPVQGLRNLSPTQPLPSHRRRRFVMTSR